LMRKTKHSFYCLLLFFLGIFHHTIQRCIFTLPGLPQTRQTKLTLGLWKTTHVIELNLNTMLFSTLTLIHKEEIYIYTLISVHIPKTSFSKKEQF
jgi:hypothetical protein